VTADDFGRSATVNAATERLHRAGLVTHASLMVHAPAAEEAVAIARRNPQLRVGLHLTLCDDDPARAGLRWFLRPQGLAAAIRVQFEKFRAFGLEPSHWDGHCHLHLHPTILRHTLPIAREFGFTFTRLVREPGPPALVPWIFQILSARAVPHLRDHGIGFADQVFGLRATGRMTRAHLAHLVETASAGTTEIYFHPGTESDADL
jgi:predicted glycoside hydrolase/deacetylase ChbG (UPF0249 family)